MDHHHHGLSSRTFCYSTPSPLDNAPASAGSNRAATPASRSALAVGTVGRVGEELLNCLLESPDYNTVNVIVEAPMRSMLPRLQPWQVPPSALSDVPLAAPGVPVTPKRMRL